MLHELLIYCVVAGAVIVGAVIIGYIVDKLSWYLW